ncbi:MAG: MFS transporter [Acetobacteraceae bacterium]|nr:MFS transporter [Acetobacteraceae bacterium]
MSVARPKLAGLWREIGPGFLPFADAGTTELPMRRLLRLSLFQVTVGMAVVLMIGTLNRVMIVELGVPAWLVAVMVSLPLVFAPFRAVVGFRSDNHRSVLGWRRVPYLWFGTLLQFGGLSIMPFALIILSGDSSAPGWVGDAAAGLAFLLVGAGLHTVQTVGLALATDLAPVRAQPKVVALLCMMLLLGMVASALIFGLALSPFSEVRLIQVVQGAALLTMVLNAVALWKQEPRQPGRTRGTEASFVATWRAFCRGGQSARRMVTLGIGTFAFSMQDILLEPYGGKVLGLPVAATTAMTALLAIGGLIGFGIGARMLGRGADPYRLCGTGILAGLAAFTALIFAAPLAAPFLFALGVSGIGLGAGLFAHCTLTAAMSNSGTNEVGLVLGIWGAVQASAAGCAVAAGGLARDVVGMLADRGTFGPTLHTPATGYVAVYLIEIGLLFATLVAVGPLVRPYRAEREQGLDNMQPTRG